MKLICNSFDIHDSLEVTSDLSIYVISKLCDSTTKLKYKYQ